jgi:hypothetical protein
VRFGQAGESSAIAALFVVTGPKNSSNASA